MAEDERGNEESNEGDPVEDESSNRMSFEIDEGNIITQRRQRVSTSLPHAASSSALALGSTNDINSSEEEEAAGGVYGGESLENEGVAINSPVECYWITKINKNGKMTDVRRSDSAVLMVGGCVSVGTQLSRIRRKKMRYWNEHFPKFMKDKKEMTEIATEGFTPQQKKEFRWTGPIPNDVYEVTSNAFYKHLYLRLFKMSRPRGEYVTTGEMKALDKLFGYNSIEFFKERRSENSRWRATPIQRKTVEAIMKFPIYHRALLQHIQSVGWLFLGHIERLILAGEDNDIELGEMARTWKQLDKCGSLPRHMKKMLTNAGFKFVDISECDLRFEVNLLWLKKWVHKWNAENPDEEWDGKVPRKEIIAVGNQSRKIGTLAHNLRQRKTNGKLSADRIERLQTIGLNLETQSMPILGANGRHETPSPVRTAGSEASHSRLGQPELPDGWDNIPTVEV